jgi:hypothetical protein
MVDNNSSPWVLLKDMSRLGESALEPWTEVPVVARRYKSSSPEAEAFIHDPLSVMMDDAQNDASGEPDALEKMRLIGRDWHVSTLVVNHHATLSIKHLNAVVALKPDNPSMGIMIMKQSTDPA